MNSLGLGILKEENIIVEFASQIFIDGGDPEETRKADELLKKHGHVGVQGQTTNPSLIVKRAVEKLKFHGSPREKLDPNEAIAFYRQTVEEMAEVTAGPISIQVLADQDTRAEAMLKEARDRITWIPNAVIKFPTSHEGISAASVFCKEGPVNMTLTFTQEQAAAIYIATLGRRHEVFVSPFIGRLDDRGISGMDVVANILRMFRELGDKRVKVIAASIRRVEHIVYALDLACDVISIPFSVLTAWANLGFPVPGADYHYDPDTLTPIPYEHLLLNRKWIEYAIDYEMTASGVTKFMDDWRSLVVDSK